MFVDKSYAETIQRIFDVVKKSANGVDYIIFALENQQKAHYAMPLRHMLNDALLYYRECTEIERKNARHASFTSSSEFLSKFKKTDRLHPVISICVYYGEEVWDGPVSLKEMMDIPKPLEPLVADYKIHLVQIRNSQHLNFHHPDVKTVFEVCRLFQNDTVMNMADLYQSYPLTPELGSVIGTIVGSQRLIHYATDSYEKNGGTQIMWKSVKRLEEQMERELIGEAEARGIALGEAQGEAKGEARGVVLGQNRHNTLVKYLLQNGRLQDLERSVSDEDYLCKLYEEFHL